MQAKNYPISQWAEDDKPREKLLRKSPNALSNTELLALLINTGGKGRSAVDIAQELMMLASNDLNNLFKLTIKDLLNLPGIGEAKAVTIMAALELGRRRHAQEAMALPIVTTSRQVAAYLRTLLRDRPTETFAVLYLNRGNRIKHFGILGEGGVTSSPAEPRTVVQKALEVKATRIVLCHNHPSGNIEPSAADRTLTQKIKSAAQLFDIELIDHIIVAEEGYYSFADDELL